MEEKEFKAWLEEQRRSLNLSLDAEGQWWHDDEPFVHQGLIKAFNRGIDRHSSSYEPIIRIGATWCYFKSKQSPFIVRRVISDESGITGFLLNTEVEIATNTVTFHAIKDLLVVYHPHYRRIRFDRSSQAALAPFLSTQGTELSLQTCAGNKAVTQSEDED
jgi:hypothetical protein